MFHPPLSAGSRLARRATTLPHSIVSKSMFMPMRCSTSVATCASAKITGMVEAADDPLSLISRVGELLFILSRSFGPRVISTPTSLAIGVPGTKSPTSVLIKLGSAPATAVITSFWSIAESTMRRTAGLSNGLR
jgi:hypothetical protein